MRFLVVRFISEILKAVLTSIIIGLFLYMVTVSVIMRKFPPTMADLQTVAKKVEFVAGFVFQQMGAIKNNPKSATQISSMVANRDSLVEQMKAYEEIEKVKAKKIEETSGEFTFASTPPPDSKVASADLALENAQLKEKVRTLEEQLNRLRNQLQKLQQ